MNDPRTTHADPVPRAVAVVGLLGVGLIHLLDSIGKYSETRYIFWLYIALIVGAIAVAGALVHRESRLAWAGTALLAASALAGFIVNRTVGLPNATDDIGNWTEPLGLASLFVEGCLLALALYRLGSPAPAVAPVAYRDNGALGQMEFGERRVGVTD